MTIAIDIFKRSGFYYIATGQSVIFTQYYAADPRYQGNVGYYQSLYGNGAVYNSPTPDGVTYFASLPAAEAHLDSVAWTAILGNLNSNLEDPAAGTYVAGSIVDLPTPISNVFATKVDKVTGYGLSQADFTTAEKTKLFGIASGATVNDTDANLKNRANHTGTQTAATISDFSSTVDSRIVAVTNVSNGIAGLDSGGKVPASILPSYVDDVLEYANLAAFPGTGETGKIYIAIDTNKPYRWTGSAYVWVNPSPGSTDALTEGSVNLYFTNARAQAAQKMVSGTTVKTGAFPTVKSATVASGVAVFHLTTDGLSTGTALYTNGVDQDSVQVTVNDANSSYQYGWSFSNSNKTLTVTVNKFTTANILSGLLGQAPANGAVVKLSVMGN